MAEGYVRPPRAHVDRDMAGSNVLDGLGEYHGVCAVRAFLQQAFIKTVGAVRACQPGADRNAGAETAAVADFESCVPDRLYGRCKAKEREPAHAACLH